LSLPGYEKKQVLITVKTYPTPSEKYQETVCTAGITSTGEWIRLYPIRFRHLDGDKQYPLFSWIEVDVKKSEQDSRPESYHVDPDSLKIIRRLDPKKDLSEKRKVILPLLQTSIEALDEKYIFNKTSLGIIKPHRIEDFIIEQTDTDWTPAQKYKLNQESFFDRPEQIKQLEKVPYNFSFRYYCNESGCKGHTQRITSWEINQAYRNYVRRYRSEKEALKKLKEKYLGFYSGNQDGYFFVGTTWPYPSFIIIGHFSYPIKNIKGINKTNQTDFFDNI